MVARTDKMSVNDMRRVIQRLERKTRGFASAIITPFPMSHFIKDIPADGVIYRYMFAGSGVVKKAVLYVEEMGKSGATFEASIGNVAGTAARNLHTKKQLLTFEFQLPVEIGDRLTVSIKEWNPQEDKPTGVWIAFLWTPNINSTSMKQVLLEDLRALEAGDAEGT